MFPAMETPAILMVLSSSHCHSPFSSLWWLIQKSGWIPLPPHLFLAFASSCLSTATFLGWRQGKFFMWSRTQVPEDAPRPMSFSITIPSCCSVLPVSHLLSLAWVLLIYLLVHSLWGEIKHAHCQALVFPMPLVTLPSILYWLTIRWSPYLMLIVLSTENRQKPRRFLLPKFREANK